MMTICSVYVTYGDENLSKYDDCQRFKTSMVDDCKRQGLTIETSWVDVCKRCIGVYSVAVAEVVHIRSSQGRQTLKVNPPFWTEIVRTMSTQKIVTTEAVNALGEKVKKRICSESMKAAEYIYELLKYKRMPFRKIKVCSTQ